MHSQVPQVMSTDDLNGNFDVSTNGSVIAFGNMKGDDWNIYLGIFHYFCYFTKIIFTFEGDITSAGIKNVRTAFASPYRDEDVSLSPDGNLIVFKTNQYGITQYNDPDVCDIMLLEISSS